MAAYKQLTVLGTHTGDVCATGVFQQTYAIRNEMPVLRLKGIKEVYSLTMFFKSFQPSMADSGNQNDLNHRRYE